MEIVFQNRREDFAAFNNYMVKDTEQGKTLSAQAFRLKQISVIIDTIAISALIWGATGKWIMGLSLFIFLLLIIETLYILESGFKPRYFEGIRLYSRQEKLITPKDLQIFQLSRTLIIDENWLEIRSSEAIHRWRWRRVDKIGLTTDFIFIHVGNCPVVYVPKRDFPSEQDFIDFGKVLVEMKQKYKDQPIGAAE